METQLTDKSAATFNKISAIAFFPLMMVLNEMILHVSLCGGSLHSPRLAILFLTALALGLMFNALAAFLPNRILTRIIFGLILLACSLFAGMEYCVKQLFGTFFSISSAVKIAPTLFAEFSGTINNVITTYAGLIFCWALPVVLYLIFSKKIFFYLHLQKNICTKLLILAALSQAGSVALCCFGSNSNLYFSDYAVDGAITHFGLCTDAQLEMTYAITGVPKHNYSFDGLTLTIQDDPTLYNISGIDFSAKAKNGDDPTIQDIDNYVSTIAPSAQNEYTGIFKDKNLIMICAESFSPIVVDPELTPTLYKLTHEGFVFTDYYQPLWGQSTTSGEFSFMTGMIPTLINNSYTFLGTIGKNMYYSPGWTFRRLGYQTKAYHNGDVEFYDRHLTHPNMGYDYAAQGYAVSADGTVDEAGALTFATPSDPADDELFQQTLPSLIQDYTDNGTLFHTYYMTISGHGEYNWGMPQGQRNADVILSKYPELSEPAGAYLAYNMDLEKAMAYLINQLQTAGIADNTVICMTADHYPYFLLNDSGDHYNELTGNNDSEYDISRYKNTLVIWSGSMVEDENASVTEQLPETSTKTVIGPITINTPATAIDILPTLYNLFGINYDSRLFSGRDLLAPDPAPLTVYNGMPIAIIPTAAGTYDTGVSWKTGAGTYDNATGAFTPNEGVAVDDNYVNAVKEIISAKYAYVQRMIESNYFQSINDALTVSSTAP